MKGRESTASLLNSWGYFILSPVLCFVPDLIEQNVKYSKQAGVKLAELIKLTS